GAVAHVDLQQLLVLQGERVGRHLLPVVLQKCSVQRHRRFPPPSCRPWPTSLVSHSTSAARRTLPNRGAGTRTQCRRVEMGFMDKAKAAANDFAAKADTALANSGLGGPGAAVSPDKLLRDLGVVAY